MNYADNLQSHADVFHHLVHTLSEQPDLALITSSAYIILAQTVYIVGTSLETRYVCYRITGY